MDVGFLIASIVVSATPGSGALFTMAAGLSRGTRAALIAAVGCTLGILPHLVLALSGAAAVLTATPLLFEVLRWSGVVYLLVLAWGAWRDDGGFAPDAEAAPDEARGALRVIRDAVLINLLNPKLTLFFFVFLPMFVDGPVGSALPRMAMLGGMFMFVTLVVFALYGIAASRLRGVVRAHPGASRMIGRGFAAAYLILAALLALTPR